MITDTDIKRIQKLRARGYSKAKAAKKLALSRNTIRKYWDTPLGEESTREIAGKIESGDLLSKLYKWLSALCKAIPLTYADENALVFAMRKEIDALDPLMINQMREDKSARVRFFVQFISGSELGSRYRSDKTFGHIFIGIGSDDRCLPDLIKILNQILAEKDVRPQGPPFRSFITANGKREIEAEEWANEGNEIAGEDEDAE